jgi:acetyl esterase/lipase
VQRDIAFCTGGDLTLLMDIYFPNQPKSDPAPVVLSQSAATPSGSLGLKGGVRSFDLEELLRRGYIVASSDRRDPPKYRLPAPFEDAKCAVRYLRANAAAYHLDPNQIGAWGCSMGGWMASMLALTDASAGLEGTGGFAEQSSRVQAAVVMDGAVDVSATDPSGLQWGFGDISLQDPLIANVSSLTHVSKDDPPFLIFVSEGDNFAPPGQTKSDMQRLYDGLIAGGVPATLVVVKGANHCFEGVPDPSLPEIATMVGDFFDQNLK